MAPCHAFKPFSAALASFLHQTLALRLPFARHHSLLTPSAAPWASQTATTAPLYGIPKLTDGTLPRLQTLLGNFGFIPAPNPCLQVACARHQTLLKPSAAPWAGQTATAAPLYGIPKLTDGTLPRLQTLLGSFGLIPAPNPCLQIPFCPPSNSSQTLRGALGRADRHHSTSLCHSETGRHPATPSNPERRFAKARLPPQHLLIAFRK